MGLLGKIGRSYLALRHSKGFGVHSPFAYDLVGMVISPGRYAYYGYSDIDGALFGEPGRRQHTLGRRARLVLRFLVALRSGRLVAPGEELWRSVARGAGTDFSALTSAGAGEWRDGDFVYAAGMPAPQIAAALAAGAAVMAPDPSPEVRKTLTEEVRRGVVFEGSEIIVAIPREEMAKVIYSMKF